MSVLPGLKINQSIRKAYPFILVAVLLFLLRLFFMMKTNLLVEEAYYWNYSNHLDFSFLDHPPMVAFLIKLGTSIFAISEWAVRFASIPCWILSAYYSFKLSSLICKEAGWYSVLLISILPFFFIHSLIITPDIPLILSWSASLYFLYQALVLDKNTSWYWAGVWIGLGLLSKYTIVLLGLSTLIYLIWDPRARKWFLHKEPYYSALIAFVLFTPVIYWNATHHWVSFLFQGSRRIHDSYSFSFHELLGLTLVFLSPVGLFGAGFLFLKKYTKGLITNETKYFIQVFSLVPLLFFSGFSLFHEIKFNWIGPIFLAIIPWLALLIIKNPQIRGFSFRTGWLITSVMMFCIYSCLTYCIFTGKPKILSHVLSEKFIPWDAFTQETYQIAQQVEHTTHDIPIIIPLDTYNIASELSFYQQKLLEQRQINTPYPVVGSHVFGFDNLMYNYWDTLDIKGKILILISRYEPIFTELQNNQHVISSFPLKSVPYYKNNGEKSLLFYYKVIHIG